MCNIPKDFRWSFSKISAYEHCPMSFKLLYLDHVADDGNYFSDYGTFCHELLEGWAKGEIPSFLLASEYEDGYYAAVTHSPPPFPRGMEQKYYDAGLAYFTSFDGFGDVFEVLSVEEKFELKIGGYTFVGIADLVLRNKETGKITVIDHKSKSANSMKKEIDTYRKQLYIYAAYVKERWGEFPERISFNMFKEGYFIDEDFSEDAYNETMQWVVDTIEKIYAEQEWKVSPSSYFCRFLCGGLDVCPAKDAVLYAPKKGKQNEEATATNEG